MTRLLLAALLTAFAGAAVAQTVTVTKDTGEVETVQPSEVAQTNEPREPVRTCLRSTGSRVTGAHSAPDAHLRLFAGEHRRSAPHVQRSLAHRRALRAWVRCCIPLRGATP